MTDKTGMGARGGRAWEDTAVSREKRGSARKATTATFTIRVEPTMLYGAGRNISSGGAYLVTSDPIPVEITWQDRDGEHTTQGRLVRIDRLAAESAGIALQFERAIEA